MHINIFLPMVLVAFAITLGGTETDFDVYDPLEADTNCTFTIWNQSKNFYDSRLIAIKPNFMHFTLQLQHHDYNATPGVFRPLHWVWTYTSPTASYPYLSWNIDHGLLSFGLLDVKTVNIPFVQLQVQDNCTVTFGSPGTTSSIVKALTYLIINMADQSYHKYEQSYFCYLAVAPGIQERTEYYAALYLNYPIAYLNYNCCMVLFSYVHNKYQQDCEKYNQYEKWIQCTLGPYILGLIIFMYFPILLLEFCAWLSKDEKIYRHDVEMINKTTKEYECLNRDDREWVFLDGKAPITLLESFNFLFFGLNRNHPILASRIRRLICILLAPSVIFIQLRMYADGIGVEQSKITVSELVKEGTPMGFLSLLADREDRIRVFAPLFGGPVCLLIMYYVLAIVFLVFPRSLKQIVERGMPNTDISSPLFLHVDEIIKLSMLSVTPEPGYENGAAVCKCGIYMIFNKKFWLRVLDIQRGRFHLNQYDEPRLTCCLKYAILPFYLLFCFLEILLCTIYYGIPVFGLVTIMVKGAAKSFFMFRMQNRYVCMIFRNTLSVFLGTVIVLALFLFFLYSVCLIFIQSFSFISQIIIFCFVAVIVYPSVSFGYLFFFVVLLYYVVRLVKDFGDGYLELLSIAVEKSHDMYSQINHLCVYDGHLLLSNVQAHEIRGIRVNDQRLDIPQNVLQRLGKEDIVKKIVENDNVFGIPKRLFDVIVQAHRPLHIQALKILFQLVFVICLVTITMSITSKFATGATSEISDVMHVIFIVTVGALPRVLEVALMNSSETVKREIEIRRIEQTIKDYWLLEADDGFAFES
ncbi:uncharacterized protein LOC123548867 [Mercenaria mercenaria]|uniref:uncharacterized protein LOC123548867 n=1 Tax=Mercenaria mercenaria TaxID=6596 RepID=UPI00234F0728|nr:uncharacterized protein LOC123548867 [Mercenaria mercenaria]XP_053401900.1 uncharacterized protein LOC123548867 [Mercenaria mercenaria]